MANDGAVARLAGRFPPGTKVGLYRGHSDGVGPDPGLGAAFKTATVDADGNVEFKGLDDDERLFVAGWVQADVPRPGERKLPAPDWRYVAIHASIPRAADKPQSESAIRTALKSTLSPHELIPDRTEVITGARSTRSGAKAASGQKFAGGDPVGHPTPGGPPSEPVPHLRQEDARDVEQRSATITGTATPVNPKETVPQPRQDQFRDQEQRSATELGSATPVDPAEAVPHPTQKDAAGLEQRSATPLGQAEPVPQGSAVEIQRLKDSAEGRAKAVGKAKQKATPKPKATGDPSSAKPARQTVAQEPAKRPRTRKPPTAAQRKAKADRDRARRAKKRGGK